MPIESSSRPRPGPARAYTTALRVCRQADRLPSLAQHPDVDLLKACAEYGRLRRRIDGL